MFSFLFCVFLYLAPQGHFKKVCILLFQESFKKAKLAYHQLKMRVRTTLSTSHFGPESLEEAAVDYIVRNLDLYDVQASLNVGQNKNKSPCPILCPVLNGKKKI